MREELLKAAQEAVEISKSAGAQDAWAWASRSRSVEYSYRDGSLETVQESTSRGLSVQLYVDGRYSSQSTTDLRPDRLKAFIAEAVAMTRALEVDPFRKIPDAALFAGIRYAEAPTGERRFRPPVPASAWSGELDATTFGPICPQNPSMIDAVFGHQNPAQDEDCLALNIWSPAFVASETADASTSGSSAKLPVLVWIHGGGFEMGAGSQAMYSGKAFADSGGRSGQSGWSGRACFKHRQFKRKAE